MKFFKPGNYERFFDDYVISKSGEIFNISKERYLKQTLLNSGYLSVKLKEKGEGKNWLVHRIVAHVFLGECPKGKQINHKDGNKLNNHLSNLEYVTQSENIRHAKKNGLMPKACYRKLTSDQLQDLMLIISIRDKYKSKYPYDWHLAHMFNISNAAINNIRLGKSYDY